MGFKENLKRIRKERKVSQHELAKAVGVTDVSISSYELGIHTPSVAVAARLAEFFNTSLDELCFGDYESGSGGEDRAIGKYQERVIRAAVNYRINEEIKRLSGGMNISRDRVREIWEGREKCNFLSD